MHIKVAVNEFPLLVSITKHLQTNITILGGVFGELLHNILCKINISYSIVTPDDGETGVRRQGLWTGTFGLIQNNRADMIAGPSTITPERMEIVKFSEALYNKETGLLSTSVQKHFYKDVLAQFNSLDTITYISLISSTLFVALFISLEKKVNFFQSFWMVLKAFCSKPIKPSLPLNLSTLLLMVYFMCTVIFWVNINQVIGAYMITIHKESVITSIKDIIGNEDIIPTVVRGSSNEYLFKNQKDDISLLWAKMRKNGNQGLVTKEQIKTVEFLNSIIKKKRVLILDTIFMKTLVMEYCQEKSHCNLFVSKNFLTPLVVGFAFKLDFDQATIDIINQNIFHLKGMGIIDTWTKRAFSFALSKIKRKKVIYCIIRATMSNRSNRSPKTIVGLLMDFKPVFKLFLYALSIAFLLFLLEIIIKLIQLYFE